ncbi:MAG: futalosine hydrolase [Desulfobulbaceae bacterium]
MYLVTAATGFEMEPYRAAATREAPALVTGIGPVETAVRLTTRLVTIHDRVSAVINFGVAGAYVGASGPRAGMLDLCFAEREVLGDLGVCLGAAIEPVTGPGLEAETVFEMDRTLLERAAAILAREKTPFHRGTFVTVNCATGTQRRGAMLAALHGGLCENMEGAAVARVCREFGLPCLELRCVSNLVEDRNTKNWKLREACRKAGEVTARLVAGLAGEEGKEHD